MPEHDQVAVDLERPALFRLQLIPALGDQSRVLGRRCLRADIDARAVEAIFQGADDHRRREARGLESEPSRDICCRSVFRSARMRGHNHLARYEIDYAVAIGIAEDPAG